jgi:hypothetical protein
VGYESSKKSNQHKRLMKLLKLVIGIVHVVDSLMARSAKPMAHSRGAEGGQAAAPLHSPAGVSGGRDSSREAMGSASRPVAASVQDNVPEAPATAALSRPSVFDDASCEIADIDKRLQSLQNFLKKAKTSMAS